MGKMREMAHVSDSLKQQCPLGAVVTDIETNLKI